MSKNTKSIAIVVGLCFIFALLYTDIAFGYSAEHFPSGAVTLADNGTFVFNPRTHQYYAISGTGHVVKQGRASGGRGYCPDIGRSCRTPTGTYHVIQKGGAGCHSSRYPVGHGGAPMPYCMFFSHYYAVHGSYEVPNYNASHGCIRIHPSDARWLDKNFMRIGTKVVVKPY
jgi:lipoprotein-anchoring transpeptidase ErfK/SrfK